MQPTWNPTPGQIALLEVAGSVDLCLTGVVLDMGPEGVRIDLGASPTLPHGAAEVSVSFFQADALYLARGRATMLDDHLLGLDINQVDRIQRRATARAHVCLPVSMTALDGDFMTVIGTTVDVGVGGCCIHTAQAFTAGADPTLTIDLDEGHTVVVSAQVVSVQQRMDGWDYRLAFSEMDEPGAKLLADLTR